MKGRKTTIRWSQLMPGKSIWHKTKQNKTKINKQTKIYRLRIERNLFNIVKAIHIWKAQTKHHTHTFTYKWWKTKKLKNFSPEISNKRKMSTFISSIQCAIGSFSQSNWAKRKKEKEIKSIQIRKEDVKLFLFIDNMILYHVKSSIFKNSEDSTNNRTKKQTQ